MYFNHARGDLNGVVLNLRKTQDWTLASSKSKCMTMGVWKATQWGTNQVMQASITHELCERLDTRQWKLIDYLHYIYLWDAYHIVKTLSSHSNVSTHSYSSATSMSSSFKRHQNTCMQCLNLWKTVSCNTQRFRNVLYHSEHFYCVT